MHRTRLQTKRNQEQTTFTKAMQNRESKTEPLKHTSTLGDENRSIEVFREINTNMRRDSPMVKTTGGLNGVHKYFPKLKSLKPAATTNIAKSSEKRGKLFRLPSLYPPSPRDVEIEGPPSENMLPVLCFPTSSPISGRDYKTFEISVDISAIGAVVDEEVAALQPRLSMVKEKSHTPVTPLPATSPAKQVHQPGSDLNKTHSMQPVPDQLTTQSRPTPTQTHVSKEDYRANIEALDVNPKEQPIADSKKSPLDQQVIREPPEIGHRLLQQSLQSKVKSSSTPERKQLPNPKDARTYNVVAETTISRKTQFFDVDNWETTNISTKEPNTQSLMKPSQKKSMSRSSVDDATSEKLNPKDYPVCPLVLYECIGKRPSKKTFNRQSSNSTAAAGENDSAPLRL